jgi:hypothetical protein
VDRCICLKTKSLYLKLTQEGPDPLLGTPEEIKTSRWAKTGPYHSPDASLALSWTSFYLFVNVSKGVALGVLTQKHGGQHQPMAFLSKFLDPFTWGWPECIQAIVASFNRRK